MAGQVKFVVDAETGRAVNGFLKIVEAQRKTEDGFKASKKAAAEVHGPIDTLKGKVSDVASSAKTMVAGFLSIGTAISALQAYNEELARTGKLNRDNALAMRGGSSMPQYIKDSAGFKQQSLALSESFGVDVSQVNALREHVATIGQGASVAELADSERSALKVQQLTGASPIDVASAEDNLRDAFKSMTVQQSEGMVEFLRTRGGLKVGQQSEALGKLMPAAQALGWGAADVGAIGAVLQDVGGSEGRMGKALISAIGSAEKLKDKGLLTGDVSTIEGFMTAVGGMSEEQFGQAFGPEGKNTSIALKNLQSRMGMFTAAKADATAAMSGDPVGDALKYKLAHDQEFAMALAGGRLEQQEANAPLHASLEEQQNALRKKMTEAGAMVGSTAGERASVGGVSRASLAAGLAKGFEAVTGQESVLTTAGGFYASGGRTNVGSGEAMYRQIAGALTGLPVDPGLAAGERSDIKRGDWQSAALKRFRGAEMSAGAAPASLGGDDIVKAMTEAAQHLAEMAKAANAGEQQRLANQKQYVPAN